MDHADLDTLPGLEGANTTVEVVAKFIFDAFVGELKGSGAAKVTRIKLAGAESDVATASYFEEDEAACSRGAATACAAPSPATKGQNSRVNKWRGLVSSGG